MKRKMKEKQKRERGECRNKTKTFTFIRKAMKNALFITACFVRKKLKLGEIISIQLNGKIMIQ